MLNLIKHSQFSKLAVGASPSFFLPVKKFEPDSDSNAWQFESKVQEH